MKGNKYGRKFSTQTTVHSKGQQKREIDIKGHTQW